MGLHTRQITTTTVALRDGSLPSGLTFTSLYCVPTAAHQCIPETAPARITAEKARFHQDAAQVALKTKNMARATILATTAMIADPMTYAGRYTQV